MVFGGDLFTQRVSKHLMGKCPEKSIKKKTTESFIKESISIWGDKYDYSITEYNGSLNNVEIIYKGVKYKQRASSHLLGMAPEFRKTDESRRYDKIKIFNEVGYEEIEGFLNKYNINYKKKFKIDKIEFDYYLIDNRTIIEFRGRHHFEPIDNLGGTKTLSDIKKLDLEKEECCEDNYLNLIKLNMIKSIMFMVYCG